MTKLEEAQGKFQKADHLFRVAGITGVIFFIAVFIYIASELYIVQNTISFNQKINAQDSADRFKSYTYSNKKEHEKTQAYVKCIAKVMLKPIEQRLSTNFDQCSEPVDAETP